MNFHELNVPAHRRQQPDGLLLQRKCDCGTHSGKPKCEDCKKKPKIQRSEQDDTGLVSSLSQGSAGLDLSGLNTHGTTEATPDTAVPTRPANLIVDDAVTEPQPGQLRKTAFLDQLEPSVRAETEAALAGTGRSTADCPYLDRSFAHYRAQSSDHVENALRRFAPETRNARTATEYIPLVAARVRQGVERWAGTGDLSGVPEGMTGGLFSGLGSLLFAPREGGARTTDDPATVRARLGQGRPLDSGVRSRMESAFGRSFTEVRTHTDATGTRLSAEQNAKAFTVGEHIAFGTGEYRPGTLVGDALIAHELAHVTQQAGPTSTQHPDHGALEQEADRSAVGAVTALWGAPGTAAGMSRSRSGSGVRLQRCASTRGAQSRTPSAAGGLTCPPAQAPAAVPANRAGQDARAQAIIAFGNDTSRPVAERSVEAVRQIICQYFPADVEKINSVTYDDSITGLRTTTARAGSVIRGDIRVGRGFLDNFGRGFAREVLRVRHEIQHVEQWRAGMVGEDRSDEREFLAHHRVATATELPGTGRMQHSSRVTVIDAALGYYYCLSSDKRREYQAHRDELLARRPQEVAASGNTFAPPPTTCVGDNDSRRRQ